MTLRRLEGTSYVKMRLSGRKVSLVSVDEILYWMAVTRIMIQMNNLGTFYPVWLIQLWLTLTTHKISMIMTVVTMVVMMFNTVIKMMLMMISLISDTGDDIIWVVVISSFDNLFEWIYLTYNYWVKTDTFLIIIAIVVTVIIFVGTVNINKYMIIFVLCLLNTRIIFMKFGFSKLYEWLISSYPVVKVLLIFAVVCAV